MGFAHRLESASSITLEDFETDEKGGMKRAEGEEQTAKIIEELVELQELMYAAGMQSLLMILQGRDTSGKDGTIRTVIGPLNSQSCTVTSFKAPTADEIAHDFLWRVHAHTPAAGTIRVFNRSHYEDVLAVRVHELAPKSVWKARYEHINAFERLLSDSGTIILKLYLHISRDEQEKRLLEREEDATKAWKLSVGDWKEREHWDAYTAAYEDVLGKCSTEHAPWLVVPSDRKWFRNLAVAEAMRDALVPHRDGWMERLDELAKVRKREIAEYRGTPT
jgi:PPK2 family polyphosphate:nucleotide phosphotransferase